MLQVEDNKIKIRVYHFSLFNAIRRYITGATDQGYIEMSILTFINPDDLLHDEINVTLMVVLKKAVKVNIRHEYIDAIIG